MNANLEVEKINQIQYLNAHDEVARLFFAWAASRQNESTETTIKRAHTVCHVEYWQMRELFQRLCEIGLATYVTGRRGHESRLRWLYSLRLIGKAANMEVTSLTDNTTADAEEEPLENAALIVEKSEAFIDHGYKLRPECDIKVRLPANLSSKEAERVAAWIRTLPFE